MNPRRALTLRKNRFYTTCLSQIGENTIVILSTHIVEDVSTLCSNLCHLYAWAKCSTLASPSAQGLKELERKIYSKEIKQSRLKVIRERYRVISTQLKSGNLHIRILQMKTPRMVL
jgi:ABC-type multidrug transport system ATPase subunit